MVNEIVRTEAGHSPERLTPGAWNAMALAIFLLVFVAGGIWAWRFHIAGAVIAPGAVSPESGIKTVQHPQGGIIKKIEAREGDEVKAGQILMELDDKTLRASLAATNARLDSDLAEMARLRAERDNAEDLTFPPALLKRGNHPSAASLMRTQRQLFAARRNMLKSQKRILRQKIAALEKQISGLRAALKGKQEQARLISEEVATVTALFEKGQALKPRLLALKRTAAALEGERGDILGRIASARETMAEIRAQIISLDRDRLARVLDRLAALKKEAAVLRQQRADLLRKLERTKLRAPVSGRVLNVAMKTIGGVIAPRQPVLTIVPSGVPLVIRARVRTTDIDDVSLEKPARVAFPAFGGGSAPRLRGKIIMISPAPLVNKVRNQPYYEVKITISAKEMQRLGKGRRVVPGMPAETFITTREQTPLQMLLAPLKRAVRHVMKG